MIYVWQFGYLLCFELGISVIYGFDKGFSVTIWFFLSVFFVLDIWKNSVQLLFCNTIYFKYWTKWDKWREGDRNMKVSPSVKPASYQRVHSHHWLARTANSKFSSLFLNLCIKYDLFPPKYVICSLWDVYVLIVIFML